MGVEIPHPDSIGATSCHQRKAGGTAYRLLAIGPPEKSPALTKAINIGSPGHRVSITPEGRAQIIDRNEQHIGGPLLPRGSRRQE